MLNKFLKQISIFEVLAYENLIDNKPIPIKCFLPLLLKALINIVEFFFRYIPGPIGIVSRRFLYKVLCKKIGKSVIIDVGVNISHPWNLSVGDNTWIDSYVQISVPNEEVIIGKRVHIGPFATIGGAKSVIIEDYVGISSHVSIFTGSATPVNGKRMSGPMVPMRDQAYYCAPVILKKDSVVGNKSVILPGVTLNEGSVVGALTSIDRTTNAWGIYKGGSVGILRTRQRKKVNLNN